MTDAGAEQVWSYHELMDKGSTPVVWDGHVYLQGERKLACVDLANGRGVWIATMEMRSPQYTSLIGADGKLMFTYDGLLMFAATPDKYRLLTQSKINTDGLLADESTFRKIANMDELEKTSEGRKTALKTWRDMFAGGPLRCASPAIVNGRLYIRIEGGLVCYDLKQ